MTDIMDALHAKTQELYGLTSEAARAASKLGGEAAGAASVAAWDLINQRCEQQLLADLMEVAPTLAAQGSGAAKMTAVQAVLSAALIDFILPKEAGTKLPDEAIAVQALNFTQLAASSAMRGAMVWLMEHPGKNGAAYLAYKDERTRTNAAEA